MVMSASCTITNNTGETIVVTGFNGTNNFTEWIIQPPVGTKILNGSSCRITSGNGGPVFPPRPEGFNLSFVDTSLDPGGIYFDDPVVGEHHFGFNGDFKFNQSNPNGNNYMIDVKSK